MLRRNDDRRKSRIAYGKRSRAVYSMIKRLMDDRVVFTMRGLISYEIA